MVVFREWDVFFEERETQMNIFRMTHTMPLWAWTFLVLASCSHTNMQPAPPATNVVTPEHLGAEIKALCNWEPVLSTLVSLVPGVPAAVPKVAEQICAAATKAPKPAAANTVMTIKVNDTLVQGRFVK